MNIVSLPVWLAVGVIVLAFVVGTAVIVLAQQWASRDHADFEGRIRLLGFSLYLKTTHRTRDECPDTEHTDKQSSRSCVE